METLPEEEVDGASSVARSSLSLLAANVGGGFVAFLFVVAIARTVGPSSRGVVAFAVTVPTVASWVSILGLDIAFLYLAGSRPELRRAIVSTAILAGLISGLAGAALGFAVFALFPGLAPHEMTRAMLIVALIATPLYSVQRLLYTTMIGSKRIGYANAVVVAIPFASVLAFVALGIVGSFTIETALAAWVIGRLVGAVASVVFARRKVGTDWTGSAIRSALRPAVPYGLRAYPASLSGLPIRRFDTFMLGAISPSSELGLYTAGVNIAEIAMYLPNSVANVMLPESAGRKERESALLVQRASAVVLFIMLSGAAVMIAAAPFIVNLILGSAYSGSVAPLQLMMVAMVGSSARRIYSAGLLARDRAGIVSILTVVTMLLVVGLDILLIPGRGAVGAALASAIGYCCGGLLVYVVYRRSISREVARSLPPMKEELVLGFGALRQSLVQRTGRRP